MKEREFSYKQKNKIFHKNDNLARSIGSSTNWVTKINRGFCMMGSKGVDFIKQDFFGRQGDADQMINLV